MHLIFHSSVGLLLLVPLSSSLPSRLSCITAGMVEARTPPNSRKTPPAASSTSASQKSMRSSARLALLSAHTQRYSRGVPVSRPPSGWHTSPPSSYRWCRRRPRCTQRVVQVSIRPRVGVGVLSGNGMVSSRLLPPRAV